MSDGSHLITVAIYTRLATDAALLALLPDGVWMDVALPTPTGAPRTRFAIVSLVPLSRDVPVFGRRGYEEHLYLIKAVTRDLSPSTANSASDRIGELLEDAVIPVAGYSPMTLHRIEHVEGLEQDEGDPKLAWQHRGGRYRAQYACA